MDYTIWVSYHQHELAEKYGLKEDEHHKLFATHETPKETNINVMNPVYSEMVTMWYVWKNNLKSDYVGFEHYRRHLDVVRMPKKGECQIYRCLDFKDKTVYEQYAQWHNPADMDAVIDILNEKYGEDNPYVRYIKTSKRLYANCTFLMKWGDFVRLCKFLFPLLTAYCKKMGITGNDEAAVMQWYAKAQKDFGEHRTGYQTRVVSFLAERIISAWIHNHLTAWNGIDVAVVHYNSPELTNATLRSLAKFSPCCHVYMIDNSDEKPFDASQKIDYVTLEVMDNTKGQIIDFDEMLKDYPKRDKTDVRKSNYGSAKHTKSVDYLLDIIKTPFVLIDSDVLFTQDIRPIWDSKYAIAGNIEYKHNVPLLTPFLCYLNAPMLLENGIRYFNGDKMWALSTKEPNCWYDTGAWVLEEVRNHKLPERAFDIWSYVTHFGHGSWRGNEVRVNDWLNINRTLW